MPSRNTQKGQLLDLSNSITLADVDIICTFCLPVAVTENRHIHNKWDLGRIEHGPSSSCHRRTTDVAAVRKLSDSDGS